MPDTSPRILIVRLDAIGDALAVVPLVCALRRDGARVDAVLREANAAIFSGRTFERVFVATFPQRTGGMHVRSAIDALGKDLRRERYDCAIVATEDPSGYRLARKSDAPVRVGFENGWGKPFKTIWVRMQCTRTVYRAAGLDSRGRHECELLYGLGAPLAAGDPPRDAAALRTYVLDDEPPQREDVLFQITVKWERAGAAVDRVADLARRVASRRPVRFVSSRAEAAYAQRFASATGFPVEFFDEIGPWKAAIAGAVAVLAPDSGAVHVAGMTGTPVVACFAREHFALQSARWAPWAAPYRAIAVAEDWPLLAADALESLTRGSGASYKG